MFKLLIELKVHLIYTFYLYSKLVLVTNGLEIKSLNFLFDDLLKACGTCPAKAGRTGTIPKDLIRARICFWRLSEVESQAWLKGPPQPRMLPIRPLKQTITSDLVPILTSKCTQTSCEPESASKCWGRWTSPATNVSNTTPEANNHIKSVIGVNSMWDLHCVEKIHKCLIIVLHTI